MNEKETRQFLSVLKVSWPSFQIVEASPEGPGTTEVWARLLESHSVEDAIDALHRLTLTVTEGAPNIGAVRAAIRDIENERKREERKAETSCNLRFLNAPRPSPERVERFGKDIREAYAAGSAKRDSRIAKQMNLFVREVVKQPLLDENHDWGATFGKLREANALANSTAAPVATSRERAPAKGDESPHNPTSAIPPREDCVVVESEPLSATQNLHSDEEFNPADYQF